MIKFIKGVFASIVKAQELRAQVWQLNNLTDAELRDIGVRSLRYCTSSVR
jgi:hypothetical protein